MKSLFSKVFLSSLIILIVGISLITFGLNMMYKSYIIEGKEEEMLRIAKVIENDLIIKKTNKLNDTDDFNSELKKIENYANIKVWIMFDKNKIMASDSCIDCDEFLKAFKKNEFNQNIESDKPILKKAVFDMYQEKEFYTLIYPIKDVNNRTILFLNKSIPNIDKENAELVKFSFLTVIIVAIYSAIIISIFNKKIIDDIANLNNMVKDMAKGNLDVNLSMDREDEFGELSRNLSEMGQSLKEIEHSRRKFVSNVSHDLRSPMTSISAYINGILDDTIPQDKWLHYLQIVSNESKRMINMINNILDLSKIQSGKYELKVEKIDLNSIILSLVDSYEQRIINKDLKMELEFVEGYQVFCDELLITRVLANLIDNAIKFSPRGAKILVETKFKNHKIHVSVLNTGSFIESNKLKFVWGRFNKLDDSRNLDKNSSGIGLAIVKEVISSHEEKIDVCSDQEKGTKFSFSLKAIKTK